MPVGLGSELFIPFRFAETAADAVDGGKAFRVADSDFNWRDPHDAAIFGVEVVDVERSAAGYDGEFEGESGEAGVPWSRERAERVSEALVEELSSRS